MKKWIRALGANCLLFGIPIFLFGFISGCRQMTQAEMVTAYREQGLPARATLIKAGRKTYRIAYRIESHPAGERGPDQDRWMELDTRMEQAETGR